MLVKTESDGDFPTITVEDSGKHFTYELQIRNNADGSCSITYENSARDTWTLLQVEKDGAITIEEPTQD